MKTFILSIWSMATFSAYFACNNTAWRAIPLLNLLVVYTSIGFAIAFKLHQDMVNIEKSARIVGSDKTSLMFTCSDRPGSLVDILSVFKRYSINLSHIEKRPGREAGNELVRKSGNELVRPGLPRGELGCVRPRCPSRFFAWPGARRDLRGCRGACP